MKKANAANILDVFATRSAENKTKQNKSYYPLKNCAVDTRSYMQSRP